MLHDAPAYAIALANSNALHIAELRAALFWHRVASYTAALVAIAAAVLAFLCHQKISNRLPERITVPVVLEGRVA